jgi:diguanylate cyclase (GGDEF)-like protein/PAS domain S-box-containing protein
MLKPGDSTMAMRVVRVALMCVAASAFLWLLLAIVATISGAQSDFRTSLLSPGIQATDARLIAAALVLGAAVFIRFIHLRRIAAETTALEHGRLRASEMYKNSPDQVACMDDHGVVIYANHHDSDPEESAQENDVPCFSLLYQRSETCEDCAFEAAHEGAITETIQVETAPDGTVRWFNKTLYPISREDGTTDAVMEIARDVTDVQAAEAALILSHHQLETRMKERTAELTQSNSHLIEEIAAREEMSVALRESEARFRQLIDSSPDMIILHSEGRIDLVNPAGVRMVGATSADEVLGRTFTSLWSGSGVCPPVMGTSAAQNAIPQVSQSGLKLRRLDAPPLDVEMSESLVLLDGRIHVQCVIRDVSEALRTREAINRMAYFDSLTGMPNRELFADRLRTALAGVRRNEMLLAVAFVDIDDFSRVNDAWGHDVGDAVLTQFAERLQSLLREQDTVARYGSDEFAVLAELKSRSEASMFADRIRSGLRPAFHVAERQVGVTVSLGIATTAGHGVRPEALVQRADEAMRLAKHSGPGGFQIGSLDDDGILAS